MKTLIATAAAVSAALLLGLAAASAAPKSNPANCVGKYISERTSAGVASGPELVAEAKAACRT